MKNQRIHVIHLPTRMVDTTTSPLQIQSSQPCTLCGAYQAFKHQAPQQCRFASTWFAPNLRVMMQKRRSQHAVVEGFINQGSIVIAWLLFLLHASFSSCHIILPFIRSVCFTIFSLDIAYWHKHHNHHSAYPLEMFEHLATTARRCIAPASRASGSLHHVRKLRELTSTIIWNDPLGFFFGTHWGSGPYSELVLNLEAVVAMPLVQQRQKNIVGCLAPMQEKAAQETWISVAS